MSKILFRQTNIKQNETKPENHQLVKTQRFISLFWFDNDL